MTYFENIKAYVGFDENDSALLAALLAAAAPSAFEEFSENFYEHITRHPDAHKVLSGPEQIERLKKTLIEWMHSGLTGPHDDAFYRRRSRIGRVHVHIGLPQQYMFTAMNVMRLDFHSLIAKIHDSDRATERATRDAVDRLFDLELAIMLQTYQEDSEDRLRRHERLSTIGQIAASIGHDLRNPLSVIQSSMYLLRKRAGDDARTGRHLDRIDVQVDICESIIRNLLELARNQPPRKEMINFERLWNQVIQCLYVPEHVTLQLSVESGLQFEADAGLLRQALTNLISNSIEAQRDKPGTIWTMVKTESSEVIIEVADEGPGFDADTIARAFEPLVTTRKSGTGLGLALVKGVTERHGGRVEAQNRPDGGAVVRIRLPRSS